MPSSVFFIFLGTGTVATDTNIFLLSSCFSQRGEVSMQDM